MMPRAGIVTFSGKPNARKSTLLNLIAGFDRPTSGRITVHGEPVTRPGPEKAMVFQDYALLPWLNTRENVEIGLRLQGKGSDERRRIARELCPPSLGGWCRTSASGVWPARLTVDGLLGSLGSGRVAVLGNRLRSVLAGIPFNAEAKF